MRTPIAPLDYTRRILSNAPGPFVVEPPAWGERHYQAGQTLSFHLVLIGADDPEGMLRHTQECRDREYPFAADPSQQLAFSDGPTIRRLIEGATYLFSNEYEAALIQQKTGWSADEIAQRVTAYIVTRGPKGSVIHADGKSHEIPAAHERRVSDPTGCGDAYRAGLIHGMMKGMDWPTVGRMASLMGALKVEHPGTQNQRFTWREFADQFRQQFGYALD